MSERTLKIVALIAVISIIFSASNTYLILDRINTQENQLDAQQDRISQLETSLLQFSNQSQQLEQLQETISTQQERLTSLQNALNNVTNQANQIAAQNEKISELQTAITTTQTNLSTVTSDLSTLADDLTALDQSTSANFADITETVQTIEGVISDISGLEDLFDQMFMQTPAQVYEATYKSVVMIVTPIGQGSGFIFGNPTTIVTNYHVVEDETDIEIEFFDRTRAQATIIGSDAYADIAVLHVSSSPAEAEPLHFSNQSVGIGQQVVAIGNPLGLTESLSVGYISQVNRLLDLEPIIVPVYQLDLTIAPGSSGGPLLDLYGNVVGITNAGTEVGFSFAVPLDVMEQVIPSLISEGYYQHPFVGISILELSPEVISSENILNVDADQNGLLIMEVVPGYPAQQAGLTPAIAVGQGYNAVDIILAVDGVSTLTLEEWTAYMEVNVTPNQVITLTVWRSGVISSVQLTTVERPAYTG